MENNKQKKNIILRILTSRFFWLLVVLFIAFGCVLSAVIKHSQEEIEKARSTYSGLSKTGGYPFSTKVEEGLYIDEYSFGSYEDDQYTSRRGIDVSVYQGDIDWARVKEAGVEFAMIRLGFTGNDSGEMFLDEYFEANVQGATEAGIDVGIYYFSQARNVDEAIRIFSETSNPDEVLLKPYDYYKEKFIETVKQLKEIAPSVDSVDDIQSEEEKKNFVLTFRELTRILVKLKIFREFKFTEEEVLISNQEYLDYKSKYLDTVIPKDDGKKVTILDDIDFELELMYTDKINVDYIMNLIKSIDMKDLAQKDKDIKDILKKLENADNKDLRLKSDLIREFLNSIMPKLNEEDSIEENYYNFLDEQRKKAIIEEAKKYDIDIDLLNDIISEYEYSGVLDTGLIKEKIDKPLIEKVKITKSIKEFIVNLIEKFK